MTDALSTWWAGLAADAPATRVLYLGAGDGRHALGLAPFCSELVLATNPGDADDALQRRLAGSPHDNVRAVLAPVHALELHEDFGLVVVPPSLLNGVTDLAVRSGVVKRAAIHCARDGHVLLRVLNPHWIATGMPADPPADADGPGDRPLRVQPLDEDAWEQRHRVRLTHARGDGGETDQVVELVALYPRELRALAHQSGLDIVAVWGDEPGRSALTTTAGAWHIVCTPAS